MSPLDLASNLYWGGGVITGAVAVGVFWFRQAKANQSNVCPDPDAHLLNDADREAVASEFVTHADAVKKGLHDYADLLAAGDPVLRDRLRKLAGGVR